VIDLKNFYDKATYANPVQYSTGVKYLLVEGFSIADEKLTGKRCGRAEKRPDH
jgi:hypothetical protein